MSLENKNNSSNYGTDPDIDDAEITEKQILKLHWKTMAMKYFVLAAIVFFIILTILPDLSRSPVTVQIISYFIILFMAGRFLQNMFRPPSQELIAAYKKWKKENGKGFFY